MNDELRMGVVKAVVFANALREYDSDCEQYEGAEARAPLPRVLVRAARTALVLQLASGFDDGLQEYLSANHPHQRCDRMKNRIEFLEARGLLEFPDRAERLNDLRNRLAHESEAFATWTDWHQTFVVVKRALVRLGVVTNLEAPLSEPDEERDAGDDGGDSES